MAIGGINSFGNPVRSAEIYDPVTNDWTTVAQMRVPRAGHQATVLPDGRVFVTGGSSDFSDAVALILNSQETTEIYDVGANSWADGPNMDEPKLGHTQTTMANDRVLVAGGYTFFTLFGLPIPSISDEAQVYTPNNGIGSFGSNRGMRDDRVAHMATLLNDGRVLLTGGGSDDALDPVAARSAEVFDPGTNNFSSVGNMADRRAAHASTLLPDGRMLISGGAGGTLLNPFSLDGCELFDPASNAFSSTGNTTISRSLQGAVLIQDLTVVLFGGAGGASESSLDTADVYQPE